MSYGVVKTYKLTMAVGATLTSHADLSTRAWSQVFLMIPTMPSGTNYYVQGSVDQVIFSRVMHPVANSSDFQCQTFMIGSNVTNRIVLIPNGIQYVKIELSTAMSLTSHEFNLICSD